MKMNIRERLERFFFRRLQHLTLLAYFDVAIDTGLLRKTALPPVGPKLRGFSVGPSADTLLSGNRTTDSKVVRRLMAKSARSVPHSGNNRLPFDPDNPGFAEDEWTGASRQSDPESELGLGASQLRPPAASGLTVEYILDLIRSLERPLSTEGALLVSLLSRAIQNARLDLSSLTSMMTREAPFIVITSGTDGFALLIGELIEAGLFGLRQYYLRDGLGRFSLSGRLHTGNDDIGATTAISFRMGDLVARADRELREHLAKAARHKAPIIVTHDLQPLPIRIVAAADAVIGLPAIDEPTLVALIERVTGQKVGKRAIRRSVPSPDQLGFDELAYAIRPGRTVEDILSRLKDLCDVKAAHRQEIDKAEEARSEADQGSRTASRGSAGASAPSFELFEPVTSKDQSQAPTLLVETLQGYGTATDWAIDLKSDLVAWRQDRLQWSDMSTKLLLSGPPGTGKTTFARALCNSLEMPLLTTSVASWLEPGYLGDVLKRISQTFDAARSRTPCILFVDEFDGIGTRGSGSDRHENYWRQIINRCLELLDGVSSTSGVIVLGATNYPADIDPALRRSGRLENHIEIPMPDTDTLMAIFRHHLGDDLSAMIGSPADVKDTSHVQH